MDLTKLGKMGWMLQVTPAEALTLISSLASQLKDKNPNVGRVEFVLLHPQQGVFSIAVLQEDVAGREDKIRMVKNWPSRAQGQEVPSTNREGARGCGDTS